MLLPYIGGQAKKAWCCGMTHCRGPVLKGMKRLAPPAASCASAGVFTLVCAAAAPSKGMSFDDTSSAFGWAHLSYAQCAACQYEGHATPTLGHPGREHARCRFHMACLAQLHKVWTGQSRLAAQSTWLASACNVSQPLKSWFQSLNSPTNNFLCQPRFRNCSWARSLLPG
jgi:hypothetical protein